MPTQPLLMDIAGGAGQPLQLLSERFAVLATGATTDGAYSLFAWTLASGGGWPPHLHRHEDEAVVVLEGAVTVTWAGASHPAPVGAYCAIPRGTLHAVTNPGPRIARLLLLVSPGGLRELLLEELGDMALLRDGAGVRGTPSLVSRRLAAAAEKYGTEFPAIPRLPWNTPASDRLAGGEGD